MTRSEVLRVTRAFAFLVAAEGFAVWVADRAWPDLGRSVSLGYYSAIAAAVPVFLLAFVALMRSNADLVSEIADQYDKNLRMFRRAKRELEDLQNEIEALPVGHPRREKLAELEDRLADYEDDFPVVGDDPHLKPGRRAVLTIALAGTVFALLAEAAALVSLAADESYIVTLGVTAFATVNLLLLLLNLEWSRLKSAMAGGRHR